MRRALIIAGAALLIVVAILGYAVLNLNRIISENKGRVLVKISEAIGRQVEVGDVKASLGWGVVLDITGLKIADAPAFSQSQIIEASEVYGEAELLALLGGHLHLRRLVFKGPQVRIVRDPGGKLNLSALGKKPESSVPTLNRPATGKPGEKIPTEQGGTASGPSIAESEPAQGETTQSKGSGNLGALERFAVNTFNIQNGTVSFSDLSMGGEPLQITAIDFDVNHFSAGEPFDIAGKMAVLDSDQNVTVSGEVGPLVSGGKLDFGALPLELEATVGPLLLERMRQSPIVQRLIPLPLAISDFFKLEAKVSGVPDSLKIALTTDLSSPQVIYQGVLDKPAGVPFDISVSVSRDHGIVAVEQTKVLLAGLELKLANLHFDQQIAQARIDTNRFDLGPVVKTIPAVARYGAAGDAEVHVDLKVALPHPVLVASPGGAKPGSRNLQLKIVGPHLEANGTVALSGVTISPEGGALPALANLNGNVRLSGNGAVIEPTSFDLGSGHAKLQANVASFDPLRGSLQFSDDLLRLAEVVPSRKSDNPEELRQLSASGTFGGTLAAPEVSADARSGAGTVSNVEYQDLALTASYADQRVDIRSVKFNAFGGTIAASAVATMTKARPFEATLNLDNIDLEKALASQKAKAAGTVRGSLSGRIQVSGRGATAAQIKPTLRGGGKAAIQNGKLVGVNVAALAMKKTKQIPGVGDLVSPDVIARHPELFASPDTDIRQASLTFTIEGPRIVSHDIAVESPDYRILGDGSFDADKNIDLKVRLIIAKELSGELEANKKAVALLADKNGEIEIPVQIVGTLPKPEVLPDIQAMIETAAQGEFQKKAGKLLGGVLGKKGTGGLGGLLNGGSGSPLEKLFH